jgi:predicted transposase YdaD
MTVDPRNPRNVLDRSLKALIRTVPPAFFRLAGAEVDPAAIQPGDVSINLPEFRTDQVFLVGAADDPERWALHIEYQLQPDPRVLPDWHYKNGALGAQLRIPAILVVLYLEKGDRATFPDAYTVVRDGLTNRFEFHAIRLWEHADRIRSGELPELAPLLLLCEDKPTERILREERELILRLDAPPETRRELLAVAAAVGTRYFTRDLLQTVFRENMEMLKEVDFIQEWIDEALADGHTRGYSQGRAEGRAEGAAEGRAEGAAEGARRVLLEQLRQRFGEPGPEVVARVEALDLDGCLDLAARTLRAASLEELGLA